MSSSIKLNRSSDSGYLYLILDLKRKVLNISPLSMVFVVGFLWIFFVTLWKFHSIPIFPRAFIINCVKFL